MKLKSTENFKIKSLIGTNLGGFLFSFLFRLLPVGQRAACGVEDYSSFNMGCGVEDLLFFKTWAVVWKTGSFEHGL